MVEHGCASAAIGGMIYYGENVALYDQYHSDIWDMLTDYSQAEGYRSVFDFMAIFNGSDCIGNDETFKNMLVWWAAEVIAQDNIGCENAD